VLYLQSVGHCLDEWLEERSARAGDIWSRSSGAIEETAMPMRIAGDCARVCKSMGAVRLRPMVALTFLAAAVFVLGGCNTISSAPLNVSSLTPNAVAAGVSNFFLTINGAGFVSGSQVYVNAINAADSRATSFVSAAQLEVNILGGDIATPGMTVPITVVNPDSSQSSLELPVVAPPGPDNSLLLGNFVLDETGVDPINGDQTAVVVALNLNGTGGFTSCTAWVNSPSQQLNGLGCAGYYTSLSDGSVRVSVTPSGTNGAYTFNGFIDGQGNVDIINSGGSAGVKPLTSSGRMYMQDLTKVALNLQTGGWAGMFNGVLNSQYITGLMRYDVNSSGTGSGVCYDFGFQNSIQNSCAGSVTMSTTNPATGATTGSSAIELDGPFNSPFTNLTFLMNGVFIVVDANTQVFISTDAQSVTQPVLTGFLKRQASGLNTAASLDGAVVGAAYGFSGSGSNITNDLQIFQVFADGAGNLATGTMDQYSGGTPTFNILLNSSTYTFSGANGRLTFNLNAPAALDSFYTSYLYGVDEGFIMSGTTEHAPHDLRVGGEYRQTGVPYSNSSLGIGGAFVTYPSFSPASSGVVGGFDHFNTSLTNFTGVINSSQGGAFIGPQLFTGSLSFTDVINGRFTGTFNLNGFQGGVGTVTGYMYQPGAATMIVTIGPGSAVLLKYQF
jgi:hypothetical protein